MYFNTDSYFSILVANQCTAETPMLSQRSLPLVERNSDYVFTKSTYVSPPPLTYELEEHNHLTMEYLEPVESSLNADIIQENNNKFHQPDVVFTDKDIKISHMKKKASGTQLRKMPFANSRDGLIVLINPMESEYSDASKNNYIGFKALIHHPHDFPEVDAVGRAIEPNQAAFFAIRPTHTDTTDEALAMSLEQRNCLAHDEDLDQHEGINLRVFAKYRRKSCFLECQAQALFDKCGCLPYHYPDFSLAWNTSTSCDLQGLKCLSLEEGIKTLKIMIQGLYVFLPKYYYFSL